MKRLHFGIIPKLALVFVLFAAVLLGGVSLLVFENARTSLQAATVSELFATTIEKQAALNAWVADREGDLVSMSSSVHLEEEVSSLIVTRDLSARKAIRDHVVEDLQNWVGAAHDIRELLIIELETGRVIAATDASEEGKFKEDRPYFVNGKKGVYVQNPYYDLALQGPTMTIAAPILSRDGRLLAVLAGHLNMPSMNAIINRRTGLHRTDDAFLVNTSNLFITQPRLATDPSVLQRGIHSEAVERCLERNSGTVAADDYRSIPALIVYRWLPERQLCLEAKIDQAEALAPERALRSTILITGVVVLLLASALAFVLARTVTRPVRQLTLGTEEIGKGNLDYRIKPQGNDEIGQLARAFNTMAANLRDSMSENTRLYQEARAWATELEQRVAAQTETIRASEAELRALLAAMRDVILVLDCEGRYLKIAPTNPSLLYKPPDELIGKTVRDVFPPAQADFFIAHIARALESDQPVNVEYGLPIGDKEIWFDGTISPMNQDTVIWIARDITERKRAEAALRFSHQMLAEAQRIAHIGSWETDLATGKIAWSDEMYRIYGIAPEKFGHTAEAFLQLLHPNDREALAQWIQAIIAGKPAPELDFRVILPDSTVRFIRGKGEAIRDATGKPVRAIGTAQDITERKQAEEKLQALTADLERSNQELEQFAYVASHDLQEPLRMVGSYVQLLAKRYKGKLDSDADEFIGFAVDGASRMQGLIQDLLAFSRVGTRGKEFAPTNCEAVVDQVLTNLQMAIQESGAVVTGDPLPTVLGDELQLAQVFQNLISNALKFRGDAPPRVHVAARKTSEVSQTSEVWEFSVRDNGIGIDPQFAERIFVIFQRLHTRVEYAGTGIGLAICKKIVERHGGRIGVESEPGKGATFYFTIPVSDNQIHA